MKTLFLTAFLAITLVSCNHKTKETHNNTSVNSNEIFACPMHPEVTGKKGEDCSKCGMELTEPVALKEATYNDNDEAHEHKDTATTQATKVKENTQISQTANSFSTSEIISDYLKLKNALTEDDTKNAATFAKLLFKTLNSTDISSVDIKLRKNLQDIIQDAKEHTKHIGDNSDKINYQREHFVSLSKDINDLVKQLGSKQKLYQDFCPMANEGKGAIWISETKEIRNPYYGSEMLSCGSIKTTY